MEELDHFLSHNQIPDYITFSGSGEPTLNSRIGDVIEHIKGSYPDLPVAVLTNGTLLRDPSVRSELLRADLVLPSLDAATQQAFRRISRPHNSLTVHEHIRGLMDFRREFSGDILLEVFVLPGFNNDSENMVSMKRAVESIQPDRIQLNTLDRPGAVSGLSHAGYVELQKIMADWALPGMEIIASVSERRKALSFRGDIEETIQQTIARRPCTLDDLSRMLGLHANEINKYLSTLEESGKIESVHMDRGVFYQTIH